jgi:hypothetical protein
MRKTFAALDDGLIERVFQPVSDMVTHQTGLTRTQTAGLCLDIASLGWIIARTDGLSGAVATWDAGAAFLDLMLLLLGLVALVSLRTLFRRTATRTTNPLRPAMQPHRAVLLLMLAARLVQWQTPTLADAADLAMLLSAAAALYLGACAEQPPIRAAWPNRSATERLFRQ